MKNTRLLFIPAFLFAFQTFAQIPVLIAPTKANNHPNPSLESCTNYAGTLETGQFIGMSNDIDLDTIYLCLGDSILIHHLGDADLSGDPQPATEPGLTYGFYSCIPTVSGPTFQDISNLPGPGDPCILQGPLAGALYVTPGIQNGGDTWFFNYGWIQNTFNAGQPFGVIFAPMTVDDYKLTYFEYDQVGSSPGPCVNVNTAAAFEIVYLNEMMPSAISNNAGDDCIGQFKVSGGYPEYDPGSLYSIDIALASNPMVKALLLTPQSNLFNLANVQFSVPEPGLYNISLEDGKSCGKQFQIDMSGCIPFNNVVLEFEKTVAAPGLQVCVPLKVQNFDVVSGSFSVNWDPGVLKFTQLSQYHPAIAPFFNPNTMVNSTLTSAGKLSVALFNSISLGEVISIPDGENLFELCFEVLDTWTSNCSPVVINNSITGIYMEDPQGHLLAVSTLPGGVCKMVATQESEALAAPMLFPNPVRNGTPSFLHIWSNSGTPGQCQISNAQGSLLWSANVALNPGENRLLLPQERLSPGIHFVTFREKEGPLQRFKLLVFN